ncbi:MAG: pyrroline-5-carboxylate reductase [Gemmatimonadota bacterium]
MSETFGRAALPIAVLGAGNLGAAIARGIVRSGYRPAAEVLLTRRQPEQIADLAAAGHPVGDDNASAVRRAGIIILAVQPKHVGPVLRDLAVVLDPSQHIIVSTATGVSLETLRREVGPEIPVVRAMPNLGIQTLNSMTCLVADRTSMGALPEVEALFGHLGKTIRIEESKMAAATALCASGIAFFLRAIRAAGQGGVEIGFHADEAMRMAAQTAKGAAELLIQNETHPETEIDQVTTPNGCTIVGLNELENRGFSSAIVRALVVSTQRAASLDPTSQGGSPRS